MWSELILVRAKNKKIDRGLLASIVLNLFLAIALAIAFYFCPDWIGKDPTTPKLSRLVVESFLPISGMIVWGLIAFAIALCLVKVN